MSDSVLDLPCECRNQDRGTYRWRGDHLIHCSQCDGLMSTADLAAIAGRHTVIEHADALERLAER